MRKTLLSVILAIFLCVWSVGAVLAQSTNTSATNAQEKLQELRLNREELKKQNQERQEQRITVRDDFKERVATKQAEVKQRVVEKIKTIFTKILERLNAALARLDKIAERIASRIDKLKAKGINTAVAEAKLAEAEKLGAAAATAIDSAQAQINAIDSSSTNVREALHAAQEAIRSARKALFDYHKALVTAIRELKAAATLREGTSEAD